jgi:hypothetical protein
MKRRIKGRVLLSPTHKAENCIITNNGTVKSLYRYNKSYMTQSYLRSVCDESHHLNVVVDEPATVGDYVMFYNSISKVLEDNGDFLKIESHTIMSENDVQVVNYRRDPKVSKMAQVGDPTTMVHSFSKANLPKLIATTDPDFNLPRISEDFIETYCELEGTIKNVYIELARKYAMYKGVEELIGYEGISVVNGNIVVTPIKTSWDRDEVVSICKDLLDHLGINISRREDKEKFNEWVEEKLM